MANSFAEAWLEDTISMGDTFQEVTINTSLNLTGSILIIDFKRSPSEDPIKTVTSADEGGVVITSSSSQGSIFKIENQNITFPAPGKYYFNITIKDVDGITKTWGRYLFNVIKT